MARQHGNEKVRLEQVLALVANKGPVGLSELTAAIGERFECGKRAAADAVHVLGECGYLECSDAAESGGDRRRRLYWISDRGREVQGHPKLRYLLREARRLFTTCSSLRVRSIQRRTIAEHGSTHAAFEALEQRLLIDPEELEKARETFYRRYVLDSNWTPLGAARAILLELRQ